MPRLLMAVALLFGLSFAAGTAAASGDAAAGKKLHDANCAGCHDVRVYTRNERRVKSRDGLLRQIGTCEHALNRKFTQDQIDDLVKYLNETYYKFE